MEYFLFCYWLLSIKAFVWSMKWLNLFCLTVSTGKTIIRNSCAVILFATLAQLFWRFCCVWDLETGGTSENKKDIIPKWGQHNLAMCLFMNIICKINCDLWVFSFQVYYDVKKVSCLCVMENLRKCSLVCRATHCNRHIISYVKSRCSLWQNNFVWPICMHYENIHWSQSAFRATTS